MDDTHRYVHYRMRTGLVGIFVVNVFLSGRKTERRQLIQYIYPTIINRNKFDPPLCHQERRKNLREEKGRERKKKVSCIVIGNKCYFLIGRKNNICLAINMEQYFFGCYLFVSFHFYRHTHRHNRTYKHGRRSRFRF